MNKVSDVLGQGFSQGPLETYFCKQHPPEAWIDRLPFYDLGYAKTFQNQKVFKAIATGQVRGENINFESNRTSLMLEKIQTKQPLQSSKVLSSHQIPNYPYQHNKNLIEYMSNRRGYSVSKRLIKLTMFQDFPSQLPGYQDLPPLWFVLSYQL